MPRPLRFLAVPLVALVVVGLVDGGPRPASPGGQAGGSRPPVTVASFGSGSVDQAVLPGHAVRDTGRSLRPQGFVPASLPRSPSSWLLGPAGGLLVRPVAPAGSSGAVPRAPPTFA